ncbi:uncharacterized protein LOC126889407 [Diabrotica virgifera virgifera]|uniref:Dentin sialophosphoprotein-like n=1 Tax=Diabrotica virgifera virgifera TaxID=50390 RepID=A0ABM5KTV8_DIAVI|nr:uncharacterized protein LOC126889407 [Diabrotica virgifera virgifera]
MYIPPEESLKKKLSNLIVRASNDLEDANTNSEDENSSPDIIETSYDDANYFEVFKSLKRYMPVASRQASGGVRVWFGRSESITVEKSRNTNSPQDNGSSSMYIPPEESLKKKLSNLSVRASNDLEDANTNSADENSSPDIIETSYDDANYFEVFKSLKRYMPVASRQASRGVRVWFGRSESNLVIDETIINAPGSSTTLVSPPTPMPGTSSTISPLRHFDNSMDTSNTGTVIYNSGPCITVEKSRNTNSPQYNGSSSMYIPPEESLKKKLSNLSVRASNDLEDANTNSADENSSPDIIDSSYDDPDMKDANTNSEDENSSPDIIKTSYDDANYFEVFKSLKRYMPVASRQASGGVRVWFGRSESITVEKSRNTNSPQYNGSSSMYTPPEESLKKKLSNLSVRASNDLEDANTNSADENSSPDIIDSSYDDPDMKDANTNSEDENSSPDIIETSYDDANYFEVFKSLKRYMPVASRQASGGVRVWFGRSESITVEKSRNTNSPQYNGSSSMYIPPEESLKKKLSNLSVRASNDLEDANTNSADENSSPDIIDSSYDDSDIKDANTNSEDENSSPDIIETSYDDANYFEVFKSLKRYMPVASRQASGGVRVWFGRSESSLIWIMPVSFHYAHSLDFLTFPLETLLKIVQQGITWTHASR